MINGKIRIIKTELEGLLIIEPLVFNDERGYFFESYNQDEFNRAGLGFVPVQDNESRSAAGVIRGLHYQLNPAAQAKLIRVVHGAVFDVAVDIRRKSPTFGKWFGTELNAEEKRQLFIPAGFAHGFSVMSEYAVIQYKCDSLYNPQLERVINPFDEDLNIGWRTGKARAIISEKDKAGKTFKDLESNF